MSHSQERNLWLIAGLGNPGPEYEKTRHNIGFRLVDVLSKEASWRSKNDSFSTRITFADQEVLLVKPQSYMNKSGEPILSLMNFYRIDPQKLIVVHDEIDIPFGNLRSKIGGGDAGHNGLKSITRCLGTNEYHRVRIGVGRPGENSPHMEVCDWVLSRFSKEEEGEIPSFLHRATIRLIATLEGKPHPRG